MGIRWKRWSAVAGGALVVYTLAGVWLVPQVLRSQLPKYAQSQMERQASVGDVSFNPFTLRLSLQDFKLREADGAPLFALGRLEVELNWRSIVKRAWSVAEIRLVAPSLQLAIAPDGRFNIAELIATLDKHKKKDEPDSGMPRLVIAHFALEQGRVEMNDRRAGYADTYTPIDIALDNLSTLPDENGHYTFAADAAHGGRLRWKGQSSLSPIAGSGVLELENVALPGVAAYLKSFSLAAVSNGTLSAHLPYQFAYKDGQLSAGLSGAALAVRDLALTRRGAAAPFVALKQFELKDVALDLAKHTASIGALALGDGTLNMRRDAHGVLDIADLSIPAPAASAAPASAAPAVPAAPARSTAAATDATAASSAAPAPGWKVQFKQVGLDRVALNLLDDTVKPTFKASVAAAELRVKLELEQAAGGLKLLADDAAFALSGVALSSGSMAPLKLEKLGFDGGTLDLSARSVTVAKLYAEGGQLDLSADDEGFLFLRRLPAAGAAASKPAPASPAPGNAASASAPWTAKVERVALRRIGASYADANGIKAQVQDFNLDVDGVSTDLKQALKFKGGLALREGGVLTAQGKVVPSTGAVDTRLQLSKLALAPVQPLLGKHVKLKIAGGSISAQGRLTTGAGGKAAPKLRYDGSLEVAGLALDEEDNDRFFSWKTVRAEQLAFSLGPDLLDVPELRIVEPNATLIIENDRSFNAQRLLVQQPVAAGAAQVPAVSATSATSATSAAAAVAPQSAAPFPVRVRRVRLQKAKLDFADLSLRPQFGAHIYELGGVITGLSSRRDASAQIELDGRVDDYGMARVRGQLNPYAPADNTDLNVVFKNVDMVSASPYSMKFAGYKIAEGKISLDLQYRVRRGQLEGNNQVVLDKLTLGERIDSPDALKLPLELALAILKDSEGRIDLGLPVSGDLSDPQFSYGAVVWKALGNVLTKVVTSPFRALGNLFGVSGDTLETVDFDPGSAQLLPPEREKLQQVAGILAKRGQLSLTVPGQYSESADGAALRSDALRRAVLARSGAKLEAGERPGPLDLTQRKLRAAVRELYAERFGAAQLDQQKQAAESAATTRTASDTRSGAKPDTSAQSRLAALWQRAGQLVQGEPQVPDTGPYYDSLLQRLERQQPLPADALSALGQRRAQAIVAALVEAGVPAASVQAAGAEAAAVAGDAGKPVALKLGLKAK